MAVSSIVVTWLLGEVGSVALERAVGAFTAAVGWPDPYGHSSDQPIDARLLSSELVARLKSVEGRLDENRIASLRAAFDQLRTAPVGHARQEQLADAIGRFHEIAGLSAAASTGDVPNKVLRCLA